MRQAQERVHDARIFLRQQRKDVVANPRTGEAAVGVGWIRNVGELALVQIRQDLCAPDVEQWANESVALVRNTCQAGQARATDNAKKHRFRLVIDRVAKRDLRAA